MSKYDNYGGYFAPKGVMRVETGGSHAENPNGGVQIGMDQQGVPNLLEEGEPVFNDYVFSDNIYAKGGILKKFNVPERFAGKLYSEIADYYINEVDGMELDPIANRGLNANLVRLMNAQEEQKMEKERRELEKMLAQMSPEEIAALEQELAAAEVGQEMPVQEQVPVDQQLMTQAPVEEAVPMEMPVEQAPLMAACGGKINRFDDGGRRGFLPQGLPSGWNPFGLPPSGYGNGVRSARERTGFTQGLPSGWNPFGLPPVRTGSTVQLSDINEGDRLNPNRTVNVFWMNNDGPMLKSNQFWEAGNYGPVLEQVPADNLFGNQAYLQEMRLGEDIPYGGMLAEAVAVANRNPNTPGNVVGSPAPGTTKDIASFAPTLTPQLRLASFAPELEKVDNGLGEIELTGNRSGLAGTNPINNIPAPSTINDENGEVVVENPSRGMLTTIPRYAGIVGNSIAALSDAFAKPDTMIQNYAQPVLPVGRMDLQPVVYNPTDMNHLANMYAAQMTGANRMLRNSGLGPSAGANIIAANNSGMQNLGSALLQGRAANNQLRNEVIAANNQSAAQKANFDYTLDAARANILNDYRYRRAMNDLHVQQYNNAQDTAKWTALGQQLGNVWQGLSDVGQENFAMNQVNSNPALFYRNLPNGGIYYDPMYYDYLEYRRNNAKKDDKKKEGEG